MILRSLQGAAGRLLPLIAGASLLACREVAAPAPPFPAEGAPAAFHMNVAGWPSGSRDVTLYGDTLVIVVAPGFRPDSVSITRVVPGAAQWRAFWQAAEEAGLRGWPRECANKAIVDGGGFSLELTYEGGQIQASGVNAYPTRDGGCSGDGGFTAEYRTLRTAVGALTGGVY